MRRRIETIERRNEIRLQKWGQQQPLINLSKPLTLLILFSICGFFIFNLHNYATWPPAVYGDPSVYNLTKQKIQWLVHYGDSTPCGRVDCHVSPSYPIEAFERRQVLPVTEFPLKDLDGAKQIYYRTTIRLTPAMKLIAETDPLEIHALYIWGDRFEVFVDGTLADSGSNEMLQMTLPRWAIDKGEFELAIKVTPGRSSYQGVANYGDLVIGSKKILAPLRFVYFDRKVVFFFWLLLPKLAFALFFSFVYLAFAQNRENYHFLLYSVLTSAEVFLASDFAKWLPPIFSAKPSIQMVQVLTQITLLRFFIRYFRQPSGLANHSKSAAVISLGLIALSAILVFSGFQMVSVLMWNVLVLNLIVFSIGLYFAAESTIYLLMTKRSSSRLIAVSAITVSLSISILFLSIRISAEMAEIFGLYAPSFLVSSGFLTRVADLLLFFTLASAVAAEFGNTAKMRLTTSKSLKEFVGLDVAEKLLDQTEGSIKSEEKFTTVLFTDIRSFTTMSESLPPGVVVDTLNQYFDAMAPIIAKHGGHIDKYIGDSIMAVWGLASNTDGNPKGAIYAAIEMREALVRLNARRLELGLFELKVGIGIHSGRTVAGVVGSQQRKEYTVIGDPVNVAARLQDQTKAVGFDILIGEAIVEACRDLVWSIPCGTVGLRGRNTEVSVFKLLAVANQKGEPEFGSAELANVCAPWISQTPSIVLEASVKNLHWPLNEHQEQVAVSA